MMRVSDLQRWSELMHMFLCREDENRRAKMDIKKVWRKTRLSFDGVSMWLVYNGNGIGFVFRDAHGIRTYYDFINDEVVVAALKSWHTYAFNVGENEVKELHAGRVDR